MQGDQPPGARQKPQIHSMLAEFECLQAVGQRFLVARKQSTDRGAVEQKLRQLRTRETMRGRRVSRCLAFGDLGFVRLLAVEDCGDVGDGARRRDERRANIERHVRSRRCIFRRGWSRHSGSLFLFFTQHAGTHDRRAAGLPRLFQFAANGVARIADLAAHASAQLFRMRLPTRFDDLLVRGGTRARKRSDDGECGAKERREAAARVEPVGHALSQRSKGMRVTAATV